jgi:hypothetical protein
MDHDSGALRLDLKASWSIGDRPRPQIPPGDELLCDPAAGWLCDRGNSDGMETGGNDDGSSSPVAESGRMLGKVISSDLQ